MYFTVSIYTDNENMLAHVTNELGNFFNGRNLGISWALPQPSYFIVNIGEANIGIVAETYDFLVETFNRNNDSFRFIISPPSRTSGFSGITENDEWNRISQLTN